MSEEINELNKNRGILHLHESFATEEDYRASKCLSYSILKDLPNNPGILLKEKEEGDKEWFTFGTLVDLLLTGTAGDLDRKVFVNDKIPSPQYKSIADYIIANSLSIDSLTDEMVERVYTESGSAVNWKPETKKAKLLENCSEYLSLLTEHKDKLIVTTEMMLEATNMTQMLRTHHWTEELFLSEKAQLIENVEILYQYKIKFIYEGLQCKSMIDILHIDHDQKIITPLDLKTGHDAYNYFARNALCKYKYGYQGTLYREGITQFIKNIPEFDDYSINTFRFVYVCRQTPTFPLILTMSEKCHVEFRDFGVDSILYSLPPLVDILAEAEYYMDLINEGEIPTVPYNLEKANGNILVVSAGDCRIVF